MGKYTDQLYKVITENEFEPLEDLFRVTERADEEIAELCNWTKLAYAKLGVQRESMTDEEIRIVQEFLGPLEADN